MRKVLFVVAAMVGVASADERDDAKREFAAGQAADKSHDLHGAIEHYLRAYELSPHPFALYNIASDYEQLGQLRDAVHFYEKYIAATEDGADRERVKKQLFELKSRPSAITIHTMPEGAKVTIDNAVVGTSPYTGSLRGGRHRVVVELDGQREQKELAPELGEPLTETFRFRAAGGAVQVTGSPPGALVQVDGMNAGVLPMARVPEPPGEHVVRVTAPGYVPFELTTIVTGTAVTEVEANLNKGSSDDATPGVPGRVPIYYLFGFMGGADVKGGGGLAALELGIRAFQYDIYTGIGKAGGATEVDVVFRYFFTKTRIAPYIGAGYSYLKNGGGYEAIGGIRFDLLQSPHLGVSLVASMAARSYAGSSGSDGTSTTESGGFFPVTGAVELLYR